MYLTSLIRWKLFVKSICINRHINVSRTITILLRCLIKAIMPQWMVPWRHTVVIMYVYVRLRNCVSVCVFHAYFFATVKNWALKLQCKCNMTISSSTILWIDALLCNYGVIYSPWHPLQAFQSQAKTELPTADCFSTKQLSELEVRYYRVKHKNETFECYLSSASHAIQLHCAIAKFGLW